MGDELSQLQLRVRDLEEENRRLKAAHQPAESGEWQALLNILPVGVAIARDPQANDITVNPSFAAMLGIDPSVNASTSGSAADQLTFRVLSGGVDVAPHDQPMQVAAREGREVRDFELAILRSDGHVLHELGSAVPLYGANGKPRGSIGVFLDITERKRAEEALRQNEAALNQALDVGHMGTWDWDLQTGEVRWSPGHWMVHGLEPGSALPGYEIWRQSVHPDDVERVETAIQQARAAGTEFRADYRTLWPDQSIHWVEARGRFDHNHSGVPIRMRGVVVDITDRKTAELMRAEVEQRYWTLFHLAPVGMAQCDPATGRFLVVNDKLSEITGYSKDELLARHCVELTGAANAAAEWEALLKGDIPSFKSECPYHRKDKARIWVSYSASLVKRFNGDPLYTVLVVEDITRRRQAEEATRASEAQFRALANAAPVMIWVSGLDGAFTWFNESWLKFTGRSLESQIGAGWSECVHPDDHDRCLQTYRAAFTARSAFSMEYRLLRHDGEWRWVLDRGAPHVDAEGEFRGFLGSCVDIEDLKRTEQALRRANTDLQQFAYSASHDLREPLRNVAVFAELASRRYSDVLEDRGREYLGYVTEGAKRMDMLVADLLAYTQSSMVQHDPVAPADASAALTAVLKDLEVAIVRNQASVDADSLPSVRIAPVHLQQVFRNLIENALKYRSADAPHIRIRARRQAADWIFSVQDNGIGIEPQYHEKVFGIFRRLHPHGRYPGTGIGLAICQKLIERYGGKIWVESEFGKGATFFFSLPGA